MATYRLDLADRKLVDQITDPETLTSRVPRLNGFFQGVKDLRREMSAGGGGFVGTFTKTSGWTKDGTMQHAARVPVSVFTAMLEVDPEFGTDEKKFIAWLERNPQFCPTERVP